MRCQTIGIAAALVLCCLCTPLNYAYAEPFGSTPFRRPVDDKLETPVFELPAETQPLELPPIPEAAPDAPLSKQIKLYVEKIRLDGNTIFSDAELSDLIKDYEHREINSGELEELRQAITLHYINHGYINSGAVIPDQQVADNTITIQIVEGHLEDIHIRGSHRLKSSYLSDRILLGSKPPLNVDELGKALQLLQQNPRLDQLHANLIPGAIPGEAVLDVEVEESQAFHLWAGADNTRPPSVGGEQGLVRGLHQNLSGRGDTLSFEADLTEGLEAFDVSYTIPITPRDTELKLWYVRNDSKVVERPFNDLDIKSDEQSFGIALNHPVYRTLNTTLTLGMGLDLRKSNTELLGKRFSFTPAADNGQTRLTVVRLTQEWLNRHRRQVIAGRSTFSFGIDAFDATVNGEDEDGKFFSWLGQLQWAHRLGERNQLILRSDVQLASDSLPSLEQFAVGGLNTVRGYRENRQVTDQGFSATLEFRYPVWNSKEGRSTVQLIPFYDYGAVWNRSRTTSGPQYFSSLGVGVRWEFAKRIQAGVYIAHPFQDFDDPDNDIQDDGIHFTFLAKLY
jgi:hemolysin activation/secretion protein